MSHHHVTSSTGKKRSRLQRADDSDEEGPAAGDEAAAENQEVSGETGAVGRGRTGAGCVQHYMSSGVPGPPLGSSYVTWVTSNSQLLVLGSTITT